MKLPEKAILFIENEIVVWKKISQQFFVIMDNNKIEQLIDVDINETNPTKLDFVTTTIYCDSPTCNKEIFTTSENLDKELIEFVIKAHILYEHEELLKETIEDV
jgi:hypothetical protein